MADRRLGGILFFKVNGEGYNTKGNWTYNLGQPKREAILGAEAVHGYKEMPQVPMIEGTITDTADLDLKALLNQVDGTITLELANGKVIALREAWYAGDGNATTEEGEIEVRFEGMSADEVS